MKKSKREKEKKYFKRTLLLFFLMWASIAGQYVTQLEFGMACLAGLIDIVIISIIMMLIPCILRIINKEKLEVEHGKKICKWNSIIAFIFSTLISGILFNGTTFIGIGGLGAIAFYFINKWSFVKNNNVECYLKDNKETEIKNKKEKNIKKEENIKEIKDKKNNEKDIISDKKYIIIIAIFVVIITVMLMYIFDINSDYNKKISKLNKRIEQQENKIEEKDKRINELKYDSTMLDLTETLYKEKALFLDDNIVFVIDGYGNYYYTYDEMETVTQGIGEYMYWAYNEELAISLGYTAWR